MKKFLQNVQPSSGGKENMVDFAKSPQNIKPIDTKSKKPTMEVNIKDNEKWSIANVQPSLYKKSVIEDLTTTGGPSEKYWEVIAERRRKALKEVLEENQQLEALISTLEIENMSCKNLLESTVDLVNTLKEVMNQNQNSDDDDDDELSNKHEYSYLNTSDGYSSGEHIRKKMKISNSDDFSDRD